MLSNITLESQHIAVRAYSVNSVQLKTQRFMQTSLNVASEWSLVFDLETTIDVSQQLRIGAYQVYQNAELWQAGLIIDHDNLSEDDIRVVQSYTEENDLCLKHTHDFIDEIFFGIGYELRATIIGFNLPFDISRLAIRHSPARGKTFRGGFSFQLSQNSKLPHVQVKHLSSRAALIQFTVPAKQDTGRGMRRRKLKVAPNRGFFIDVKTLSAAMTAQSHSLESLTQLLQTKHRKSSVETHGETLTSAYLDYAVLDVQCTWECFEILQTRYNKLELNQTPMHRIFSEAGMGKAYFKEIGISPWRNAQSDFPSEFIGILMSSYYGGRSEVNIRREITRVLHCDFLSMYPTVCTLMGLWRFVIAQGIDWLDATNDIQALLESIECSDLQNPLFWKELTVLVQVQPDSDLFPVRARYNDGTAYTIALNYLTSESDPLWYTLADCIASRILTGKAPKIVKALRFVPKCVQENLKSVAIAGNPDYSIDPYKEDLFKRLIELRTKTKQQLKVAKQNGNLNDEAQLQSEQLALKITANSTSYGIFVELNVNEHDRLKEIDCYGFNGKSFSTWVHNEETPGHYFHPLIATLITGAARLMLALTERLAKDAKIDWAFCDTDSMALSQPKGMADAEFIANAKQVQDWFTSLNPYEHKEPLFKIEDANYRLENGKPSKNIEALYCFAISSKRYTLFNLDGSGKPIIRKASAHGLGHLRQPYGETEAPASISSPQLRLSEIGIERWQYDLWYQIIMAALNGSPDQVNLAYHPALKLPAVSRYAATSPHLFRWFKHYNADKPYRNQVKPFNFMLMFQASRMNLMLQSVDTRVTKHLPSAVAPFDKDLQKSLTQCFDRYTGEAVSAHHLKTYAQSLAQYHLHPEDKFNSADYTDRGFVQRRHIGIATIEHIGKEANRWEEQLYLGETPEAQIEYGISPQDTERLRGTTLIYCKPFSVRQLALVASMSVGYVASILAEQCNPKTEVWLKLLKAAKALTIETQQIERKQRSLLEKIMGLCSQSSLRRVSQMAGIDHANLANILKGKRRLNQSMRLKLGNLLALKPVTD